MHRLFLDQNIRIEIAASLRADGHEVIHASEVNLGRHTDELLFHWAVERGMTIVTFDVDFAERAYWRRDPHPGIVRLRLEPQTPAHVLPVLRRFLASWPVEKLQNALVVLAENKVRVRRF
jgi:predicted nuclease of predicted toxin-antitoxin system